MSDQLRRFFKALLGANAPAFGVFGVGVIIVAIVGNWFYDLLLNDPTITREQNTRIIVVLSVLVAFALLLWFRYQRQLQNQIKVYEYGSLDVKRGLIWLLSPNNVRAPLDAVLYHREKLEHLWLIADFDMTMLDDTFQQFEQDLREHGLNKITIHKVNLFRLDVQSAYEAVNTIFTILPDDLTPQEVVVDITGGLKTISVGVALACIFNDWLMSYVQSKYDPSGNIVQGSQHFVSLDVDFLTK